MRVKIDFPYNFRWLIAGVTGSGKSYFVGYLCEELRRLRRRFIVLDTKTNNLRGLSELKDVHEIKVYPNKIYNWHRILSVDYAVVFPTRRCTSEELTEHYLSLLNILYNYDRNRVIIIEEAHRYSSQWHVEAPVELLVREGRGSNLSLIFTTQRINEFNKLIWSQCDRTYLFRFFIPQDIEFITRMIYNFREINQMLGEHDVLEYNHKTGEHRIIKAYEIMRITKHYG